MLCCHFHSSYSCKYVIAKYVFAKCDAEFYFKNCTSHFVTEIHNTAPNLHHFLDHLFGFGIVISSKTGNLSHFTSYEYHFRLLKESLLPQTYLATNLLWKTITVDNNISRYKQVIRVSWFPNEMLLSLTVQCLML